jgi:hypothetical protein
MLNRHRVILRYLVQILNGQRAFVLDLGIVVEEALDPIAGRRLARLGRELVEDAGDRDELDVEGIADRNLIQQYFSDGVVVTIDEARDDRHALCVEHLRALARKRTDLSVRTHRNESAASYRERLGARQASVHGVDVGVANDQVLFARVGWCRAQTAGQGAGGDDSQCRQAHELATAAGAKLHFRNSSQGVRDRAMRARFDIVLARAASPPPRVRSFHDLWQLATDAHAAVVNFLHGMDRTRLGCSVAAVAAVREMEAAPEAAAIRTRAAAQVGTASPRMTATHKP